MLLNFTKKRWTRNFAPGVPRELLFDPFCRVVSRIDYKPELFRFDLRAEYIPDLRKQKSRGLTWEECCLERAESLRMLDRGQYLIAWSGGIDSTTMMVSLMKAWPEKDLKRVRILLSHSSVYENPRFFDRVISKFSVATSVGNLSGKLLKDDTVLLTGELGDQLFGSDIMGPGVEKFGDDVLWKGYAQWAPQIIELWTRSAGSGKAIFERFAPIVDECPFPVRTVFDFFWWMNFSQKWQHVKYRFVEDDSWDLRAKYGEQLMHFFDTTDFQHWSMENHDLKIEKNWQSYKMAAKKFIVSYTKHGDDLLQKKIPSLALRNFLVEKRPAVTSDLKVLHTEEEISPYVR